MSEYLELCQRIVDGVEEREHRWVPIDEILGGSDGLMARAATFARGSLIAVAIIDGQSSTTEYALFRDGALTPVAEGKGGPMAFHLAVRGERAAVPRRDGISLLQRGEEIHFPLDSEVEGCAIDPDGRVAGSGYEGTWLWSSPFEPARKIEGLPDGQRTTLAFSPDGDELAVAICGRGVCLVDVESREPRQLIELDCDMLYEVAYAPDGGRLAVAGSNGEVHLCPLDGPPSILRSNDPREVMTLSFSPDGAVLASGERELALWSGTSGAHLGHVSVDELIARFGALAPRPRAEDEDEDEEDYFLTDFGGSLASLSWLPGPAGLIVGTSGGRLLTLR